MSDAVELINQHIDYEVLLAHYDFDRIKPQGSMIRSACKLHGGNNSSAFVVNTSNNLWYCHTGGCGGGDAYSLVQKLDECNFATAVQIVARIFGVDIENMQITERKEAYKVEMKKWLDLMRKRSRTTIIKPYSIPEEIRPVTKFRNFKLETLEHFGLGYVKSVALRTRDDKPYTLENRLVFPIINNGVQVGISFRRLKNADYPKWSHQPVDLETRHILYNFDAVRGKPIIVICEGHIDVWAYHEAGIDAVATYGAHVTDEQYELLLKSGADLIWSFDGDDAGRIATEKAIKMFHNKANQYVIEFSEGEDPETLEREELRKRYDTRRRS